tara:strand:- start:327 stop:491 length:165 start_codon:yes stop_codon:yes gene_type:complete
MNANHAPTLPTVQQAMKYLEPTHTVSAKTIIKLLTKHASNANKDPATQIYATLA